MFSKKLIHFIPQVAQDVLLRKVRSYSSHESNESNESGSYERLFYHGKRMNAKSYYSDSQREKYQGTPVNTLLQEKEKMYSFSPQQSNKSPMTSEDNDRKPSAEEKNKESGVQNEPMKSGSLVSILRLLLESLIDRKMQQHIYINTADVTNISNDRPASPTTFNQHYFSEKTQGNKTSTISIQPNFQNHLSLQGLKLSNSVSHEVPMEISAKEPSEPAQIVPAVQAVPMDVKPSPQKATPSMKPVSEKPLVGYKKPVHSSLLLQKTPTKKDPLTTKPTTSRPNQQPGSYINQTPLKVPSSVTGNIESTYQGEGKFSMKPTTEKVLPMGPTSEVKTTARPTTASPPGTSPSYAGFKFEWRFQ